MLEVTNRCNLACPMCLRDKARFALADMDPTFVDHLLATNPRPRAVWPYGYGEPLLYPHLPRVIRSAKRREVVVSLSTNATRLDRSTGKQLLDSGLDYLVVAIDGTRAATYEAYRKGARYEVVLENVRRFIDQKAHARSKLHLTIQMIRMEGTQNQVGEFRNLWRRSGVDAVRVRDDLLPARNQRRPPSSRPCFFLWRGPLFVQAAGTVIPCPYYHGAAPVGDLRRQTVNEVWNSEDMQALRSAHLNGTVSRDSPCADCPRYQPHPILASLGFFATTGSMRRLLPYAERLQEKLGRTFFE